METPVFHLKKMVVQTVRMKITLRATGQFNQAVNAFRLPLMGYI